MKKDLNYVAAVEKAIAEKYGKEAVQDFRSTWEAEREESYLVQLKNRRTELQTLNDRKKFFLVGDVEIRKKRNTDKTNRTCPVCKTYSFSSKDDLYMNRFECCNQCYIEYVEFREDRWNSGWRPQDGEYRPPLIKTILKTFKAYTYRIFRRVKKWLIFWT